MGEESGTGGAWAQGSVGFLVTVQRNTQQAPENVKLLHTTHEDRGLVGKGAPATAPHPTRRDTYSHNWMFGMARARVRRK